MFYFVFAGLFVVGLYLFLKGFRVYWKFRVLDNVPLTAIRGLAMGFVRVRGRATGDEVLNSPVTNQPCYYYKLQVEKWNIDKSENKGWWAPWRRESDAVPFYLEDETGKVLVYPRGAELDLARSARTVIDGELPEKLGGRMSSEAMADASDANLELLRGMAMLGSHSEAGRYLLTEHAIFAGADYDLAGSCFSNPLSKGEGDRNLVKKGTADATFVISDRQSDDVTRRLDLLAVLHIYGGALLAVVSASLIVVLAWAT